VSHRYELSVYWSAEDGVYVAEVPELPGCTAHGATPETAVANVQGAIGLWTRTAR
jgi:predicted RNase H-like HicB family nuclease